MEPDDISGFEEYPSEVRSLLTSALALTKKNLGYQYGSADPAQKGMDCSGTIYYLLSEAGLKDVPRSSSAQYDWVKKADLLIQTTAASLDSPEFDRLKPGDLLFWSGTYDIQRSNSITHAMIYLGKAKSDSQPLMVGASDGRTYRGKKCFGVSVFDFRLPRAESKSRFAGYGPIPGLSPAP